VVGLSALAFLGTSGSLHATPAAAAGGTALPAGWELCILQGIGAPVTGANVANLDEWQVVEGGSTNNSAAYDPFNTRRTTDVFNAALPAAMSSNGFPAFANWLDGCAATVATLFQPNMGPIIAALRSGNVAPPGAFLASVDQSQWCAPAADGTPCYINSILGAAGSSIATAVLGGSSALDVYGNVKNDVREYQLSVLAVSNDQSTLTARDKDLSSALAGAQTARNALGAAQQTLEHFAVDEYVSTGLYVSSSFPTGQVAPTGFGPQSADGIVAHQYENIAASDLVDREQAAASTFNAARLQVKATSKAVADAFSTLSAASSAQTRSLAKLVADVATMQTAGACTSITLTSAPLPPVSATGSSSTTSASGSGSISTTTTTAPSVPSTPTTSTSTSTTTTTTPGVTGPAIDPVPTTPSSTTTTTVPAPTTTTTVPSPTTTTTTTTTPATPPANAPTQTGSTPAAAPSAPASANPAAFNALQGCVAALAPPAV
jgi:hypothetical protein